MAETERRCPQCESPDLECKKLGMYGSTWPVLFGSDLFRKKGLLAYACKRCCYVFLYLEDTKVQAD